MALEGATNENNVNIILGKDLLSRFTIVDHADSSNSQLITNGFFHQSGADI
jgi:hypothetical protein